MSEVIKTLDYHEINPTISIGKRDNYYSRQAARAVLIDQAGRIALMHVLREGYYKLPGGGIDEGEEVEEALDREMLEEVGATIDVTRYLGTVIEWRDFSNFKQVSYAFKALLREQVASPDFTQNEIDAGFQIKWTEGFDEAISLVESHGNDPNLDVMFMSRRDAAILRAAHEIE